MFFDGLAIQDLQRALMPPALPPLAIERAWLSPGAEEGRRILGAAIDEQEAEGERWRGQIDVWRDAFARVGAVPRSVLELEMLDRLAHYTGREARSLRRDADRTFKRLARDQKQIAAVDASAGRLFGIYMRRSLNVRSENAETLAQLASAIKEYRERIDYRGRAKLNTEERAFNPNAETIAAMEDARAGIGMQRLSSIADLMAELHAEDD